MNLPVVGAYAGWQLEFRAGDADDAELVLSIGSSDYYASIEAALPAGLDPGTYNFVVEGITSEDYADLYRAMGEDDPQRHLAVFLRLYWKDGGAGAYLVDLAGLSDTLRGDEAPRDSLVAVLRVTALKRRAGSRRYEVAIEAREWAYDRALRRIAKAGSDKNAKAALGAIAADENVKILLQFQGDVPDEPDESFKSERAWERGEVALTRMQQLGEAMKRATGRFGLGMYVIRNGILYAGPDRLILGHEFELTPETGLLEVLWSGRETSDPNFVPEKLTDREPTRDLFDLTLRGRPDIKPGDFVVFERPVEETDATGVPAGFSLDRPLGEAPGTQVKLYVRGVTHRLGRQQSFVTVLRGVTVPMSVDVTQLESLDAAWFAHSPPKNQAVPDLQGENDSPEGDVVGELRKVAAKSGGRRVDVGQVRAANVRDEQRPNQTSKLRRGLTGDAGKPYGATSLDFDATGTLFSVAPYATPFAWGKFGLVLPRYPGMRVALGHRNGDSDDPIDLGALWHRGDAPKSEPGDYWLGLPAEIAPSDREQVEDGKEPTSPSGKASNDLIDASGNRVIEVGKLTVRVGVELLAEGGARPAVNDDHVHIEHQSGAKISIDQNGNVTIFAKKKLTLAAGEDITLDTPQNVIVKTGGFMDVKERS